MSTLRTTNVIHGSSAITNIVLDNQGRAIFGPNSPQGRAALYVNAQSNRVGVNTETPSVELDVDGAINATSNATVGGTLSVTGNVIFSGDINADNRLLTVGGMQIRSNITPTSGAGIELFRSSSGFGQIQAYDRGGSALIGLYINSLNWNILDTGLGSFGDASNSTGNNGVAIGGQNGSLNLYTTRYSTDCFQILNTSGSGNNIAHQFFGNGKVNLAGGDLRIEQITGDISNSVRITTDPSSSGSGSTLVFNMDNSQDAVTIYNAGLRVGSGGVPDKIQLDGSAGNATFAGQGGFGTTSLASSSRLTLLESFGNGQTLEIVAANSGAVGSQPGIRFTKDNGDNLGGLYGDVNSSGLRLQTGAEIRWYIEDDGLLKSGITNTPGVGGFTKAIMLSGTRKISFGFNGNTCFFGNMADGSGTGTIDTGISVNAGNAGGTALVMISVNAGAATNTNSALYFLKFYYDGNNSPADTLVEGAALVVWGQSANNTLTFRFNVNYNWTLSIWMVT